MTYKTLAESFEEMAAAFNELSRAMADSSDAVVEARRELAGLAMQEARLQSSRMAFVAVWAWLVILVHGLIGLL
jgi:hypothetical protein